MTAIESYANFCYDQAGSYVLDYVDYFDQLRPQISKSGLNISLPEYVSMIAFTTAASAMTSFFLFTLVFLTTVGIAGIFLGLTFSIITGVIGFTASYLFPSLLIQQRSQKIRDTLPFATMYMSTLAGTGTSVTELFKILANAQEYGEVSKEAEKISRDINNFGMDVSEALERAAQRSPNEDLTDLLWGMNHAISSGGELRNFLSQRADTLMDDYQRRVKSFSDQLSLLVEMYITLVIVGSIIFTSMSIVMGSFAQGETVVLVQVLSIFIGLPLISGMFILLIRGISPGGIR